MINEVIFNEFPVLESERLIYREMQKEDASGLFSIRGNDQAMQYMDSVWHSSVEDSKVNIEEIQKAFLDKNGINWAIVEKDSNQFIGYFGYWRLDKSNSRAEIGYALIPEFWGKGYMKEAALTLIDFGFKQLKVHSIEANINPSNDASRKLLLKLGFKKEAYFRENYFYKGKFLDSEIYSLLEGDLM